MSAKRAKPSTKWINGTAPQTPVADVARLAVKTRLKTVRRLLKNVRRYWDSEIEHVHQLRVASRRAEMAIHVFATYLPKKQVRWTKRRLKQFRRAANVARDVDVLRQRYQEKPANRSFPAPEWEAFLQFLVEQRRAAQVELGALIDRRSRKTFKRHLVRLLDDRIKCKNDKLTFRQLADQALRPLLDDFFQLALRGSSDIESLHRLRIAGKRIRYVLELVAGAYPASRFKPIYRSFSELQKLFGTVNDHATAVETLGRYRNNCGESLRQLIEQQRNAEQRQLDTCVQQLQMTWVDSEWRELQRQFELLFTSDADVSGET